MIQFCILSLLYFLFSFHPFYLYSINVEILFFLSWFIFIFHFYFLFYILFMFLFSFLFLFCGPCGYEIILSLSHLIILWWDFPAFFQNFFMNRFIVKIKVWNVYQHDDLKIIFMKMYSTSLLQILTFTIRLNWHIFFFFSLL